MQAVQPGKVAQVLHAAQLVIEQGSVGHVSHAMRDLANAASAEQRDLTLAGLHQPGDDAQQRALARAIVTQDDVQPPGREARRNATQGGKAAEELHQIFQDDDRRGGKVAGACHEMWVRDVLFQRTTGPAHRVVLLSAPPSARYPRQSEQRPVDRVAWAHTWKRIWLECW